MKNKFIGGYIKASSDVYSLMVMDLDLNTKTIVSMDRGYYYVGLKKATYFLHECEVFQYYCSAKQFYINNGKLSRDKPSFTDELIDSFVSSEHKSMDDPSHPNNILSIKDDNGKEYVFEKPEL